MKNRYALLLSTFIIVLISCNNKIDTTLLKKHFDTSEDVRQKIGRPDSIGFAGKFYGYFSEAWFYHKDSVVLVLNNDTLVAIYTPEIKKKQFDQIKEMSKAIMDTSFDINSGKIIEIEKK